MEETTTQKKVTAYGKRLEEQLVIQKQMLWHLENRVLHLKSEYAPEVTGVYLKEDESDSDRLVRIKKHGKEYTEAQITIIKTNGEIDVLKRVIAEKEQYYKNYLTKFEKDITEVENNWLKVFNLAKNSKNPNVQKLMASIHWNKVEADDDAKIEAYRLLKKYF